MMEKDMISHVSLTHHAESSSLAWMPSQSFLNWLDEIATNVNVASKQNVNEGE